MVAWLEDEHVAISENVTVDFDVALPPSSTKEMGELLSATVEMRGEMDKVSLAFETGREGDAEPSKDEEKQGQANIHLLLFACDRLEPLRRLWASLLRADYSMQPRGVDLRVLVDFSEKQGHEE